MRMGFSKLLPALVALEVMLPAAAAADVVCPEGYAPFSITYDLMFRAMAVDLELTRYPSVGPFSLETCKAILGDDPPPSVRAIDAERIDFAHLFILGSIRYRAERHHRADDLPSLFGGMTFRPAKNFGAFAILSLDRARALDPAYTGKKYRGLAGETALAALSYTGNKVTVTLGRLRPVWGPRPVNLILSETADPLDLLAASYRTGRLAFHFLFARLDKSRPDSLDRIRFPDYAFNDNRYLAAHRLDLRLHRRLRIGITETILFGGEGRSPELYYLNPLQIFHGVQMNEKTDDNTIVGFDVTALPGWGTVLYGQAIIDDFQLDDKSQGDQEPDEWGLMAGLFRAGRMRSWLPDLRLEYVRLTNRTYHQVYPRNRYLYHNKPLGHPLGPDADSVALTARFWPDRIMWIECELAYCRYGQGSLHASWDEPWMAVTGDYDEPFPTGVVEKTTAVALRAGGFLPLAGYAANHLFFSVDAGWKDIKNRDNVAGRSAGTAWFDFTLTWMGFADIGLE
ncbi:MAG: capsule assembly Wzi family protein [candidate division Zixibacteria bacterium]|nr:capsule assembly Wzi family protein [candidate division Zixibacteria bacterium]